jgi:hypothetical protein
MGIITTIVAQYGPNIVLNLSLLGEVEILPTVYPLKPEFVRGLY